MRITDEKNDMIKSNKEEDPCFLVSVTAFYQSFIVIKEIGNNYNNTPDAERQAAMFKIPEPSAGTSSLDVSWNILMNFI